jgi:hypothetical protein
MHQNCSVCGLGARATLEQQIREGVSVRAIARQWHISRDTIAHHKASHMTLAPKVALTPPAVVTSPAATPEPEPLPAPVRDYPVIGDKCIHCFKIGDWHRGWNGQWEHSCGHPWHGPTP